MNEDDEELKREEEEHEDIYSDDMSGWRISAPLRTQPGASRRVRRQQDSGGALHVLDMDVINA